MSHIGTPNSASFRLHVVAEVLCNIGNMTVFVLSGIPLYFFQKCQVDDTLSIEAAEEPNVQPVDADVMCVV